MLHDYPQLEWVRPAQQARSQETRQRLLEAAEELIAEKGVADIPVAEIARRAGLSVGAIYARFRDKAGILRSVRERLWEEVCATADAALDPERWAGATISEIAREAIAFMVRVHRERIGVLREAMARAPGDPQLGAEIERVVSHICERLTVVLLGRVDEIGHPDPALAAKFGFRLLLGVLKEAILFGTPGAHGIPRSDEQLTEELTRAFLGYLGVRISRQESV
jgi:AcrR family transcriptional regulator